MQITISVVKTEEGMYNAKFGTSKGGGQERIKGASFEKIADKLIKVLEEADEEGYIGRK